MGVVMVPEATQVGASVNLYGQQHSGPVLASRLCLSL